MCESVCVTSATLIHMQRLPALAVLYVSLATVLPGQTIPLSEYRTRREALRKNLDGTVVLDPRGLARLSDQEVIERLSTVRGIGRWTAEMFLLFQLRRLDVWPTGDLGVRRGYGLAWGVPMPSPKELEPLGDPFRPYRSVVAWYCWRASELYTGMGATLLTPIEPAPPA